jgi:hypothetical protein
MVKLLGHCHSPESPRPAEPATNAVRSPSTHPRRWHHSRSRARAVKHGVGSNRARVDEHGVCYTRTRHRHRHQSPTPSPPDRQQSRNPSHELVHTVQAQENDDRRLQEIVGARRWLQLRRHADGCDPLYKASTPVSNSIGDSTGELLKERNITPDSLIFASP